MKSISLILKFKLLVIILFLGQLALAQSTDNVLDSLQNKLDNTNKAQKKVRILLQISDHIRITASLAEAEKYIEQALTIAKELHDQGLIAEISMEKGKIQAEKGNNDEAENIFLSALSIYEKLDDELRILNCLNGLGIISRRKGDFIKSVKYFEKGMTYFSDNIPAKTKGSLLTNLSNSYCGINKYSLASEKLFEGLKYYEEIGFDRGIGLVYGNLGLLYQNQKDYDNAIKYHEKSLEVLKKEGDLRGQSNAYNNLVIVYNFRKEYSKAIEIVKKQLIIAKKMESEERIFVANLSLVGRYLNLEQLEKATTILNQLKPNENISEPYLRVYYTTSAAVFSRRKQYSKAIEQAEKGYALAEKQGNYEDLVRVLSTLYTLYEEQGNFKKAFQYLEKYKTVSDSLNSQSNIQELTTQAMQFEFDKTAETYELEKKALESDLRTQRIIRWAAIVIALLIGIIGMIAFHNSKRKNELLTEDLKNKETIEAQNQLLLDTQKTIETQSEKLKVLYDYKNKLFANIAHELRTPLTLIANPIKSVLKRNEIPKQEAEQLRIADRNVRSLSSTIHQILDLAKRENVELSIQPIQFDVNELIQFIANDFQSMSQFKSIQFSKPMISLTTPVVTDGEKLMIIIRNLLSNAFKFTPSNGKVSIHLIDLGDEITINVKDTGKGIKQADLDKVFNRHFQVNPANLPNEGGMGIGLSICKEYISLLKGSIIAESQLGEGSSFTIRFPKQLVEKADTDETASNIFNALITQRPTINFDKKIEEVLPIEDNNTDEVTKILIVEDNIDMSNYLNTILSEEYELSFAQDGEQALLQLQNSRPDLIISDYMMPNMNGLQLMEKLKSQSEYAGIPIIMLTAQQAIEVKLNALRIGVDDYLNKPFDNRELLARVDNILTNQRIIKAERQSEAQKTNAKEEKDVPPTMNLEDLAWLEELESKAKLYISNPDFTIVQLAEEMAVSYSNIFRKVKKMTGLTANQYVREIRFQEALKLLEAKKYGSVKAVSYSVGYRNVKYFSKNFKKRFGKNPSAYLG